MPKFVPEDTSGMSTPFGEALQKSLKHACLATGRKCAKDLGAEAPPEFVDALKRDDLDAAMQFAEAYLERPAQGTVFVSSLFSVWLRQCNLTLR